MSGELLPDITDMASHGGPLRNYSDPVDPTTDEHAKYRNWYVCNMAQASRTLARGTFSFVGVNGADPTAPGSGFTSDAVYGNDVAYRPAITRTGEGVWQAVMPQQVQQPALAGRPADEGGGLTHNLNIRTAHGQCACSDGTLRHVRVEIVNAYTLRIRGWVGATADDLAGQVITVWFY